VREERKFFVKKSVFHVCVLLFFFSQRPTDRQTKENERKRDSNNNNNNPEGEEEEEEEEEEEDDDDDENNNNINVVLADTLNGLFRDDTPRSGFDRDVLPSDVFALQLRTHRRRADERDVV
jgi:hypothetical protein